MHLPAHLDAWSAAHPFWIAALFVVVSNLILTPFTEEIRDRLYRRPGRRLFSLRRDATEATITRLEKIASSNRELALDLLETAAFQLVLSLGMTLFSAGLMSSHLSALGLEPGVRIEAFATFLVLGLVLSLLLTSFVVLARCAQMRRLQDSLAQLRIQKAALDSRLQRPTVVQND